MSRKIRVFVQTNVVGSKCEHDEECPDNWDEMSPEEQEEFLDEAAENHLQSHADYGAYVVDDGDDDE